MSFRRDPLDRRYPERLTASWAVSLIFHALFAALLFTVLVSSSQEGATESVSGGEVVTLERRSPIQISQPAVSTAALPVPHVERIAPLKHAPLAQPVHQRLPQNLHILARDAKGPPNPKPIPQQSAQPLPQPTQNVFEPAPSTQLPAAPVSVPTVAPIAVALKAPPTAAPSPAPTARATLQPSPKPPSPTAAPTAKPATPAPIAPTAAPTAAAVAIKASAAPVTSPVPAAHASLPPAQHAGVPSPSPTRAAAVAKTAGSAPSPGPKGLGSPGPVAGTGQQRAAPARPVAIAPTPSPAPAAPRPTSAAASNLNDRLRGLLPNNPVNPTSKSYTPHLSLTGRMEPTPPPEVLAQTKFIYKNKDGGSEASVVMWVISAHKAGITTMCTGWLVRYPLAGSPPSQGAFAPANGTQIRPGGGTQAGEMPPIVEGIVTEPCEGRLLVPYAGSAAPSP